MEELTSSHHQGCRWRHWKLIKSKHCQIGTWCVEFIQTLTRISMKASQILKIAKIKKPGQFQDAKNPHTWNQQEKTLLSNHQLMGLETHTPMSPTQNFAPTAVKEIFNRITNCFLHSVRPRSSHHSIQNPNPYQSPKYVHNKDPTCNKKKKLRSYMEAE